MPAHAVGRLVRGFAAPTAAAVAVPVLALFAQVVAARSLEPRLYGAVALSISVTLGVALFFDITFEEALVRFGAASLHEDARDAFRRLVRVALAIDLFVVVAVLGSIYVSAGAINQNLLGGQSTAGLLRLAAAAAALVTIDATTSTVLILLGRPHSKAHAQLLGASVRLLVLLGFLRTLTPETVVASLLVGNVVATFTLLTLMRRRLRVLPNGSRDGTSAANFRVGPAVRLSLSATATTAAMSATSLVVPLSLARLAEGAEDVAQYSIGFLALAMSSIVTTPVRNALLGRNAAMAAAQDTATMQRDLAVLRRLLLRWSIPFVLPICLLLQLVIPSLFGAGYDRAALAASILFLAFPAVTFQGYCKLVAVACGAGLSRTRAACIDLAASLVLVPCSVLIAGLYGAACAVVLLSLLSAFTWSRMAHRALQSASPGQLLC